MTEKKKPIRHYTYSLFVCHWRDAWACFIIHRQTGVEVDMTVVPTLARARREGQAAFAKASVLARDSDVRIDMRIRPPSRPVPRPKGRFPVASDLPMIEPVMVEVPKSTRAGKSRDHCHHTTPREAGMVLSKANPKLAVYTHIVLQSRRRSQNQHWTISSPRLAAIERYYANRTDIGGRHNTLSQSAFALHARRSGGFSL
jgi:hypothetical protein